MADRSRDKLSVIIPCFNEEKNIEGCLESVRWADEIFVVDSFSTDRTLDIARRYTDRVVQHEYINSAAQKNWAIPQALHDWVLVVDCDERVTPALKNEILSILSLVNPKDGYWIKRKNFFLGKEIRHSGWGRDSVLRLFRRDKSRYQEKRVHAEIQMEDADTLDECLEHHSVSSMTDWVIKINRYSTWKARDKFEKRPFLPVLHVIFRPPLRFIKDFIFRFGFLDGWRGFLISSMSAFAELVMSAKVMQLTYEEKKRQA